MGRWHAPRIVIPAEAGIQAGWGRAMRPPHPPPLDSRLRGNDEWGVAGFRNYQKSLNSILFHINDEKPGILKRRKTRKNGEVS